MSPLCGQDGDNCLCYINGIELTNEIDAAVEDAAFIHSWMLPLAANEEVELVSVEDTASLRSVEFRAHDPGAFLAPLTVGTHPQLQHSLVTLPVVTCLCQKGK